MPDWLNLQGAGRSSATGESFNVANGGGVLVTASGSINTKGAWAVVSAALPFEAHGICVELSIKSTAADQLLDLGIGSAGNEHVVVPNIYYTGGSSSSYNKCLWFPITLPVGERLVVRTQSATASVTCRCAVTLFQQGWLGCPAVNRIIALGALTATTLGTALAAPGANAWGAWTQIAATAGENLKWVMPVFGDLSIASRTSGTRFFGQMGRGAAASEFSIGPEYPWSCSSTSFSQSMWQGFWTQIEATERIAAQYAASAAVNLGCGCVVYGGW